MQYSGLMVFAIVAAAALSPAPAHAQRAVPVAWCHAVDGDTLRCGRERVRLLGIDAPELPGHCREGRLCAPGDPYASARRLRAALRLGQLAIERVGLDSYGRTLGVVYAGRLNLSCAQLAASAAIYKPQWDDGGRVARACPTLTR